MDILENNELEEEQHTISFLQTTLGIAQTRLNEMLIKSINDEARLRQTINNLQLEIDHLKSEDSSLPKNKKLDFDIWVNKENNLIIKVNYSRMGNWEYRLKSFKIN